jgi:omega-6 fatty acid desaturase (delta-12 desaturase)
VSSLDQLKQQKRQLIRRHAISSDAKGLLQVLTTLLPLAVLGWAAVASIRISLGLTILLTLLISLLMVRVFALMHECGHGSLCRTPWLNRALGFMFGVLSGMPQYVWAQHHDYHHRTNGNWDKYRGPLSTLSVAEFQAMPESRQRSWLRARHIALAPLGGFVYLIFNPRFTWMKGTLACLAHGVSGGWWRKTEPFRTRYWRTRREYWHMTANNIVLLGLWAILVNQLGAAVFFPIYLVSVSLAGGVGIALFTVQHNFDQAYASPQASWDIDRGAIDGTSFLVLPAWLNWITANIGYHHIHHLSAAIPGYNLPRCHAEYAALFTSVRRISLREIPAQLRCLLWDTASQRIVSASDYQRQKAEQAVPG